MMGTSRRHRLGTQCAKKKKCCGCNVTVVDRSVQTGAALLKVEPGAV